MIRRTILAGTWFISLGYLACDDDRMSGGDTVLNAAGGGNVVYEKDAGVATIPLDAAAPPVPSCDQYCDAYAATCGFGLAPIAQASGPDGGPVLGTNGYRDRATCMAMCKVLPPGDWVVGQDGYKAPSTNSRLCRFGALSDPSLVVSADAGPDAGATEKSIRCALAGPVGVTGYQTTSVTACGNECVSYCTAAVALCANEIVSDAMLTTPWRNGRTYEACLDDCQSLLTGEPLANGLVSDHAKNSLNCRFFQLQRATTDVNACTNVGATNPFSP
jgi:hypothetical protein